MDVRHIRRSNANVTDHRFRGTSAYANKPRPTMCGAEPTARDVSRKGAIHVALGALASLKPEWSADYCPTCLCILRSMEAA